MPKLNGSGPRIVTTRITPMLWFDREAEEAAQFYTSVFPRSRINRVAYYADDMPLPKGTVLVVEFELDGQPFTALNGGPEFKFTEAISLVVNCGGQEEVDYFWDKLTSGEGKPVQCGWLKDRFGLSWQVVPVEGMEMMADPDPARSARVFGAVMKMVKLDLATMRQAYEGR